MKKERLNIAFLELRDKLHRIAISLLHDDEDAKDAVQDTFEKLWRKEKVESDSEARNKLIHVLRNTCIDRIRTHHTIPLDTDTAVFEMGYDMNTDDMQGYEKLIIQGLTPLQQQIYALIVKDGIEYEEVARRLEISVEATRMNMSRARRKIRDNIKLLEK